MKLIEGEKYQVVAVKTKNELVIAVAPRGDYVSSGDLVELDDGVIATAIFEDDYVEVSEIKKIEEVGGTDLYKIVAVYRKRVCEWDE